MPMSVCIQTSLLAVLHVLLGTVGNLTLRACPYCKSEIGEKVAAGIFNDRFWLNAAEIMLPIPLLLLVVGLLHYGFPMPSFLANLLRKK